MLYYSHIHNHNHSYAVKYMPLLEGLGREPAQVSDLPSTYSCIKNGIKASARCQSDVVQDVNFVDRSDAAWL